MARKEPNMTSGGTTTTYLPTNNNNFHPFQHLVGVAGIGSGNDGANIAGNVNNTMINANHTATASNMGRKFAHIGGCSSNSGGAKQLQTQGHSPAMGSAVASYEQPQNTARKPKSQGQRAIEPGSASPVPPVSTKPHAVR